VSLTDFAYVATPIVAAAAFAALFAYAGYRFILYRYPMPGDRGYKPRSPLSAPDQSVTDTKKRMPG
jgi:hypothetical protein